MRPQVERHDSITEYMLGYTSEDIPREDMFALESCLEKMEAYGPKREPTSVYTQHGLRGASGRGTREIFDRLTQKYDALIDDDLLTLEDLNALTQVLRAPDRNPDGSLMTTNRVLVSDNELVHRILGDELGSMDPRDLEQLNIRAMTYEQVVEVDGIPLEDKYVQSIAQESRDFQEENQGRAQFGHKLLDSLQMDGRRQKGKTPEKTRGKIKTRKGRDR